MFTDFTTFLASYSVSYTVSFTLATLVNVLEGRVLEDSNAFCTTVGIFDLIEKTHIWESKDGTYDLLPAWTVLDNTIAKLKTSQSLLDEMETVILGEVAEDTLSDDTGQTALLWEDRYKIIRGTKAEDAVVECHKKHKGYLPSYGSQSAGSDLAQISIDKAVSVPSFSKLRSFFTLLGFPGCPSNTK